MVLCIFYEVYIVWTEGFEHNEFEVIENFCLTVEPIKTFVNTLNKKLMHSPAFEATLLQSFVDLPNLSSLRAQWYGYTKIDSLPAIPNLTSCEILP